MSWWSKPKPDPAPIVDNRLEVMSEGLQKAAADLQDFVTILKQKYPPIPAGANK